MHSYTVTIVNEHFS
jgi:hypothetical protein